MGLLFAFYAFAYQNEAPNPTFRDNEYLKFTYLHNENVLDNPKFADISDFLPKKVPVFSKQQQYCSCVLGIKAKLGLGFRVGAARNWPKNTNSPEVGGVVITKESSVGHVALITGISDKALILEEWNYKKCQHTTGRKLPIDSKVIIGYWVP